MSLKSSRLHWEQQRSDYHILTQLSMSPNSPSQVVPLRIRVIYDRSLDDLEDSHKSLIQSRVIPSSVTFLKRTLGARRPVKRIHLYQQCLTPQVRRLDVGTV